MTSQTPEEKCCDKCYSTYTTDDYPDHQTLDACINRSCECHTSKGKTLCNGFGFELRYPNGLPDTTEIEEISFKDDGYRVTAYKNGEELGVVTEYKHADYGHLFPQFLLHQLQKARVQEKMRIKTLLEDLPAFTPCSDKTMGKVADEAKKPAYLTNYLERETVLKLLDHSEPDQDVSK